MNIPFLSRCFGVSVLLLSVVAGERAQAQHWNVVTGDWNVAGNWLQNTVPDAGGYTYVVNGGTSQLTAANGVAGFLYVAGGSTLEISGNGRLIASGDHQSIGGSGAGTLSISGASASASLTSSLGYFSVGAGGNGTVNLSNGGTLTLGGGNAYMDMANAASGTLNIGTGAGAGILNASSITVVNSSSTVNFNHTDANYYFTKNGLSTGTGVAIGGTTQVFSLGSGKTTLTAASSYSGGTTFNAGTIAVSQDNNLGDAAGPLTFNGGTLETTATFTMNRATTLTGSGTFNTDAATTLTQQGILFGAGGLIKAGTGTLVLSGSSSSWTGGVAINAGTLRASTSASALGTGTVSLGGGNLELANDAATNFGNNVTVAQNATITSDRLNSGAGVTQTLGTLSLGNKTLSIAEGGNVASGTAGVTFGATALTANGATFDTGAGTLLTLGALSGNFSFIKQGAGQLTLSAAGSLTNSSAMNTLNAGTLRVESSDSLGRARRLLLNGGVFETGLDATLALGGTDTTVGGNVTINLDRATNGAGVASVMGALAIGGQTLKVTKGIHVTSGTPNLRFNAAAFSGDSTFDVDAGILLQLGAFNDGGTVRTLTKQGAGTLFLGNAAAALTDGTVFNLNGGILSLAASALGTGTKLTMATGTSLQVNGATQLAELQGVGTVTLGSNALTIQGATNSTFGGAISGTGSLTKAGTGSFTLSGANTYTGATTVSVGTLRAGAANALAGSSDFTVTDTLNLANFNQSIGSLAGSGNILLGSATLTTGNATDTTFSGAITGTGGLVKRGAGAFTLSGANTYSGTTTVQAGRLAVNGSLAGSATVNSGATLGGSGSITGTVTVANGGIIAPGNSPGVLTVGALALNNTSILNFELGSPLSDRIDVMNNLTLDGILNVQAAVGFGAGTYRLINYGGTLTNQTLVFGTAPSPFDYVLQTTTPGQVNLVVSAANWQYWDGAQTTPNNVVDGGTGTWNTTTTNWTSSSGNVNSTWNGAVGAVFKGTAGTVTIADGQTISAPALSFQVNGYTIGAAGTGNLHLTDAGTVEVFGGATATIAAPITSGTLRKAGPGTLVLTGTNTYAGGTSLNSGTIEIGNDDAFGTGTITLNGGSLSTDGQDHTIANDLLINADTAIALPTAGTFDQLEMLGDVDLDGGVRTIYLTGDGGNLCFNGVISDGGLDYETTSTSGVTVMYCGGADNLYTGLTTVGNHVTLELGTYGTAVAGDLTIQAGGSVVEDGDEEIASTVTVTVDGTLGFLGGDLQTINNLQGSGTIVGGLGLSSDPTLTVNSGNFSGVIEDGSISPLAIVKDTAGTLVLSGANTFSGGTTISAGTLQTSSTAALGSGPATLGTLGTLALTSGTNLTVSSLNWQSGGTFSFALGSGSEVTVTGALTETGTGNFAFTDGGFLGNTTYDLVTFDTASSTLTDWTANSVGGMVGTFLIRDNLDGTSTLTITYIGSSTGAVINNDAPNFTPVNADFEVNGNVTALAGGQVVNSLTFDNGSHLSIADLLQVTSGNLTALPGSSTITGGTLFAPGDLTKLGSGLLTVLSNIITGGNTYINEGALAVNGVLNTHDVFVQLAGTLKGSGLINGNVYNAGTVAPGNSPGTLTVNGNFTQASSGTLQIEVASPQVFDRLIVTGRATLAGTLQGIAYSGYKFKLGQQIPFLQAGSISGKFDNIVMPKHYRGRFLVNGGTGSLLVAPSSYTQVAQGQNQRNVARALNSFIGKKGDRDNVSLALDLQSKSAYGQAFDQIAPGFFQTLTDTVIEQTNSQNQFLAQRISSARLGMAGFSVTGLDQAALSVDRDGKDVMDAKSGKDIISQGTATKWGVWVQGNGIFAHVTDVSQVPNYHFNSGGFMVGADYTFGGDKVTTSSKGDGKKAVITSNTVQGSTLVLGMYGGYQGTYSKYNNGGRTSINSALAGAYASYSNGGFYSDAIVGGSYNNYQVSRPINFSTIDRTGQSNPYGGTMTAYLDAGYDFHAGGFTFGPLLSGQYTYAGTAPFSESGADSLDLRVSQQNANSLRSNVGGRVAFTWNVSPGVTIIPEARVFWQHEYLDGPRAIGASLNGGDGPGFNFETSDPSRDSFFAGVGLSANFGDRWSTSLYYNADFGRQDFVSHMISSSLTWKF